MTLRFEGVSFAYGAGLPGRGPGTRVFEDFSWEVPQGGRSSSAPTAPARPPCSASARAR